MWAPFGHHFTENNAFHQDMEKAAKPSNHAALRPFSVHIKHVENDTKIYYFLFETKYTILFHFARNLWVFCTKVHGGAWDFIGWFLQRAGYYTITTPFYGKETGYDTNILPFKTFAPSTG